MASSPPQPSVETSQPGKNSSGNPRSTTNFGKFLPSISAKEAHARFFSAVSEGVDMLVREHGHGRDRATENLLNEFADGCSPSEQEVFKTMEVLGLSMDDATTVTRVATAFRNAQSSRGSTVEAIDELTSRLRRAKFTRKEDSSHAKNIAQYKHDNQLPSKVENTALINIATAATDNLMGRRLSNSQMGEKQKVVLSTGRKRGLTGKSSEQCPAGDEAVAHDLGMKELLNAKICKDEKKTVDTANRPKATAPTGSRVKRAASPSTVQQVAKRHRTSSDDMSTI